tara:strand:- start:43742 stop:45202 length:1461 start_codon:yes stop_codon:yes gene_type:complete
MKNREGLDQKKLTRQLQGVERWFNAGSLNLAHKDQCGCLNYFTGVGKTFTAMLLIDEYFKRFPNTNVIIVVPNEHLVTQWKKELAEVFYKKEIEYIKVYSADHIISNKLIIHARLLIVDELDAFYSEKRKGILLKEYIVYVDILALTATYEDVQDRHIEFRTVVPIIDKIGEKEAIAKGYISEFIEYNLALSFSDEEQRLHDKYTKQIREGLSKFGKGSLNLAMKCLSGGKTKDGTYHKSTHFCYGWARYNNWTPDLNLERKDHAIINSLWNPNLIFGYALNLMKAIKNRKNLIYESGSKLNASVEILEKFALTKTIVFSQSTKFADRLYGIINQLNPDNAVIYHSKIATIMLPSEKTGKLQKHGKVRLKKRAINRINSNLSNHLITSSALDKGLDIPKLKLSITTSGTQNPTQYQQRGGRVKRIDMASPESVSIVVNLYIKNSKEIDWLRKRQSTSNNLIYWVNEIEQISYKPQQSNNEIHIDNI